MAPFKALYGRRCRSLVGWCDAFEGRPWGTDLFRESLKKVLLKISPMKGVMRFGKRGKLSPRYIGPFEILDRVGDIAYELDLPQGLAGVHPVFHVSQKKYHTDGTYIIRWDSVFLDENLTNKEEPITILDRQVRKLKSKEIASVKVQWKHRPVEEATWEAEFDMRSRHPQLFFDSSTSPFLSLRRSRMSDGLISI
ncbi:uncharacterized protein LOC132061318 [Lycium ferocissimum]|uniref:uncharacterized protein LOC132061318 n=1 Tax=Lycium ferocissimum TaxID=112874 RepID=UPI002815375C|nr:uncharacterized protein LOC132061318 [Lycium ferocissimum]